MRELSSEESGHLRLLYQCGMSTIELMKKFGLENHTQVTIYLKESKAPRKYAQHISYLKLAKGKQYSDYLRDEQNRKNRDFFEPDGNSLRKKQVIKHDCTVYWVKQCRICHAILESDAVSEVHEHENEVTI